MIAPAVQQLAQVEKTLGHDVNHFPLPLDVPVGLHERGMSSGGAVLLINVRANDQVYHAGFVLECFKHDAGGGAGPLTNQHQSRDDRIDAVAREHVGRVRAEHEKCRVRDVRNVEQSERDGQPDAYRRVETAEEDPGEDRLQEKLEIQT